MSVSCSLMRLDTNTSVITPLSTATGDHRPRSIDIQPHLRAGTPACLISITLARCDKSSQDHLEFDFTPDHLGLAAFKFDPALVESIKHLDARHRVFRALRPEQCTPGLAGNRLGMNRIAKDFRKCGSDVVWRNATRSFQFNDASAAPVLLKQFRSNSPDVRCPHHRHWFVEWLQKTRNGAAACWTYIPQRVLHEPAWSEERDWHRQLAKHLLHECALSEQV